MKIRFLTITPFVFLSLLLASVVSAAPQNQYQDPNKQRSIAAYTWLYAEAVAGNEIARRNLTLLERVYGPVLTNLSKRAVTEWQGQLIERHLRLQYGGEKFAAEDFVAGTDIQKRMEKWGYYTSQNTIRAVLEKLTGRSRVVSSMAAYSRTSFGLVQRPAAQLVSAWTLGYIKTAEPMVAGAETSARIARRYP